VQNVAEIQPPVEEILYKENSPSNNVHNKYTIGYPQGAALQRIIEDPKKNIAKETM
jgi:hypothetical protein